MMIVYNWSLVGRRRRRLTITIIIFRLALNTHIIYVYIYNIFYVGTHSSPPPTPLNSATIEQTLQRIVQYIRYSVILGFFFSFARLICTLSFIPAQLI